MSDRVEDVVSRRLLETLAQLNRLFRDHAVNCRKLKNVSSAKSGVEVAEYKSGPQLEGFVDVELRDRAGFGKLDREISGNLA